jgi:glycosyltransferase involved in cell wall biosynthesis
MENRRLRILIVGMADSVHLARWISQFSDEPIDFLIFPSSPHRKLHPTIKILLKRTGSGARVELSPGCMRWLALPLSLVDTICGNWFRGALLRRAIGRQQLDLVHIVEFQHAGYVFLAARVEEKSPRILITNWGSDIFWFSQFPRHRRRISRLLQICSFYSAECYRDIKLAREMGFQGTTLPVLPNSGGIHIEQIPQGRPTPSLRRKIIIKGYTRFVGRAITAIKACEEAADCLQDFEVLIYSASLKTRIRALKLRNVHGVSTRIIRKRTSHQQMLEHFSESRIYIGISLSDGISTSLLEAMANGCFPIQTNTGCADEWLSSDSGAIVEPGDSSLVARWIRTAVESDSLVENAARINFNKICMQASSAVVQNTIKNYYSNLLS